MDVRKLKAAMALAGMTAVSICKAIGIGHSAWFRKLNGTSEFTQSEISKIRQLLNLDDRQTVEIFFNDMVS